MNLDCLIIKSLFNYNIYNKYYIYINKYNKHNSLFGKELEKTFYTIQSFHEKFPDKSISSVQDFWLYFCILYPVLSHNEKSFMDGLCQRLESTNPDLELVESYLDALAGREKGFRAASMALEVAQGQKPWKDAQNGLKELLEGSDISFEEEAEPFVSSSLEEIYHVTAKEEGLRWPLNSLNKSLGSLRKGDYGFIFARPETGKTTFLAHVATHMAGQDKCEKPVIWFNNEQEGHVVMSYCYRAALNLTTPELFSKIKESEEKFNVVTKGKIKLFDEASIAYRDVERVLDRFGASLIIFDQIDKIKGFNSDRNDLELGAIYQWARELAKKYAPVIGVCQAGESAANKRYLTMEDVVNSKTSKQAEADWILGIGKIEQVGYEHVRHFHISKNKLVGDKDTDPEMRHAKLDVLIDQERARYKDIEGGGA